jgi:hypothetical protein
MRRAIRKVWLRQAEPAKKLACIFAEFKQPTLASTGRDEQQLQSKRGLL